MDINQYLKVNEQFERLSRGKEIRRLAKSVVCADGFTMSVQVSEGHYCTPRRNHSAFYSEVEVGYPSKREELIMPFAEESNRPTDTVYRYVPVAIVDEVIAKHGGFKPEGE